MKFLHLVWAGIWRRPGRTTLTLVSIVNAFLLFGLLQGFASGLTQGQAQVHADALIIQSRISGAEMLPTSLVARFKSAPGVTDATPFVSFVGYYQRPNQFVRAWGAYPSETPQAMPAMEVAPAAIQAFRARRDGILVGREVMTRFGWKVGDHIPLTSVLWANKDGTHTWAFTIVGTYVAPSSLGLRNSMVFDYDYLDQSRTLNQGMTNGMLVRVADPLKAGDVARSLDALTRNSTYETKTETEGQYTRDQVQQLGNVGFLVSSVVGAVFFTLLISVGGVMAEASRERTKEIGVLKAIGFSDGGALALVLSEAAVVCLVAALVGLLIAEWLFPIARNLVGFNAAIQQGPVLVSGLAIAAGLALASGLPPALRALRLPVIEALADHP